MSVDQLAVSTEYFDVLGIDVVSGRGFTQAENTAQASVVIVSETIARRLWPNGDSVGQVVRLEAPRSASPGAPSLSSAEAHGAKVEPSRTLTVVGVVRDPGRDSGMSYLDTFRGVYLPTDPETSGTWLFLRVRGNPELARQALLERLTSIDPSLGNIITLRTMAGMQTYMLQIAFWVTVVYVASVLVIITACLLATSVPALRAARLDPIATLRQD
jgi:MacB-like periplasmic core domain